MSVYSVYQKYCLSKSVFRFKISSINRTIIEYNLIKNVISRTGILISTVYEYTQ